MINKLLLAAFSFLLVSSVFAEEKTIKEKIIENRIEQRQQQKNSIEGKKQKQFNKLKKISLEIEGEKRFFLEYAPYQNFNNKDLILAFHGGGGNAENFAQQTKFMEMTKSNNTIVVFMNAQEKNWHDGRVGLESRKDIDFT